jgi:septum formation protein
MKPLTDAEVEAYLQTRKWEGCSGAYAIELPDDPYLSVVEGSVSNVIGLPMESLERALGWVAATRF